MVMVLGEEWGGGGGVHEAGWVEGVVSKSESQLNHIKFMEI